MFERFFRPKKDNETKRKLLLPLILFAVLTVAQTPEALAQTEQLDTDLFASTVCQILEQGLEHPYEEASQMNWRCSDGSEFSFTNFHREFGSFLMPEAQTPNHSDAEFVSRETSPNYNCHSFSLQFLSRFFDQDLGVDMNTWVNEGFDRFVRHFGREVKSVDIQPDQGEENFRFDLESLSLNTENAYVLLYSNIENVVLHSAILMPNESGEWQVFGKRGEGAVTASSIMYPAFDFFLLVDGGNVSLYEFTPDTFPQVELLPDSPISEPEEPFIPPTQVGEQFLSALRSAQ